MWFQDFQKCQIIICLLIGIYVSKINVVASVLNGRTKSNDDEYHQNENNNLNKIDAKNKFQCPSLFGTFSDVEDCSRFYLCVAGIPRRMPCPKFKHFDKYRRKCLSIIIAICDKGKGGKETTRSDKEITTVKDTLFLCPRMLGSFQHPTDCSKYYSCSFFMPTLKTCPEKELFDGVKKECRPESEVNCGSRIRPTSQTTLITTPLLPESTPYEVTTTPKPTTPEPTTPKPTTPEPTTPEPTTPEPTTHEPTTPEPTTPEPTTPEPTTPEPTTPEPTTPEPTTIEEQTPPEHNCDEDDLDCIITETGEIPKWFKCPVELGSHRHPSSKKLFIFCINWKPSVKKCGQDLIYSQEMETCISP